MEFDGIPGLENEKVTPYCKVGVGVHYFIEEVLDFADNFSRN